MQSPIPDSISYHQQLGSDFVPIEPSEEDFALTSSGCRRGRRESSLMCDVIEQYVSRNQEEPESSSNGMHYYQATESPITCSSQSLELAIGNHNQQDIDNIHYGSDLVYAVQTQYSPEVCQQPNATYHNPASTLWQTDKVTNTDPSEVVSDNWTDQYMNTASIYHHQPQNDTSSRYVDTQQCSQHDYMSKQDDTNQLINDQVNHQIQYRPESTIITRGECLHIHQPHHEATYLDSEINHTDTNNNSSSNKNSSSDEDSSSTPSNQSHNTRGCHSDINNDDNNNVRESENFNNISNSDQNQYLQEGAEESIERYGQQHLDQTTMHNVYQYHNDQMHLTNFLRYDNCGQALEYCPSNADIANQGYIASYVQPYDTYTATTTASDMVEHLPIRDKIYMQQQTPNDGVNDDQYKDYLNIQEDSGKVFHIMNVANQQQQISTTYPDQVEHNSQQVGGYHQQYHQYNPDSQYQSSSSTEVPNPPQVSGAGPLPQVSKLYDPNVELSNCLLCDQHDDGDGSSSVDECYSEKSSSTSGFVHTRSKAGCSNASMRKLQPGCHPRTIERLRAFLDRRKALREGNSNLYSTNLPNVRTYPDEEKPSDQDQSTYNNNNNSNNYLSTSRNVIRTLDNRPAMDESNSSDFEYPTTTDENIEQVTCLDSTYHSRTIDCENINSSPTYESNISADMKRSLRNRTIVLSARNEMQSDTESLRDDKSSGVQTRASKRRRTESSPNSSNSRSRSISPREISSNHIELRKRRRIA